jgi:hypothetical protein
MIIHFRTHYQCVDTQRLSLKKPFKCEGAIVLYFLVDSKCARIPLILIQQSLQISPSALETLPDLASRSLGDSKTLSF